MKINPKEHIHDKDKCWCKPRKRVIDGDNYWFHKDEEGKDIYNLGEQFSKAN